ncbi:MAG: choloylglycine hydrolase, partial [Duncaniella sp.]|nr:choloylglycine hydrolase [Duncaniella sp.]
MKAKFIAAAMAIAAASLHNTAAGCSRVLYVGNDSLRIVGRSLDWKTPIPTNLYVYPRGMEKKGHDLPGAIQWTS